jgi:hypothetical protein
MASNGTIDRTTKVNLGILFTMLASVAAGAFWAANVNSNVVQLVKSVDDLKTAVERNSSLISSKSEAIAVLTKMVEILDRRVTDLEKRN